jgi:pyridoxal phosphate enzyme (YggS family)
VQESAEKRGQTTSTARSLRWELIGHLQTNKAKLAARHFDRIQSVDSDKLIQHLGRAAAELGKVLPILLQINAGHDPAKFGAELEDAPRLLEAALAQKYLRVDGLMTIAPLGATPAETSAHAERTFANLRMLRDDLTSRYHTPLTTLSMGMTGDFGLAIAAGSTLVRVGTALFGARGTPVAL